jgi:hypothetical protein
MTVYIVRFTILCEMCQKLMANPIRLENEYNIIQSVHKVHILVSRVLWNCPALYFFWPNFEL